MKPYLLTPMQACCPVCHGQECCVLYSVDTDQAARHVAPDRVDEKCVSRLRSHVETLWQGAECHFLRCENCRFCFALPFVAGDRTFYSIAYGDAKYAPWKWEHQLTYDALQKSIASGEGRQFRLLEIGAGNGSFVKGVSPSLIGKENVLCIEYSDSGANEISRYGIKCSTSDIRNAEFSEYENSFDAICMFHVLEHMSEFDEVFERITSLATERADLFIAVPNGKYREAYDRIGVVLDVPPTHISRWNKKCFEIIGERYGWALVDDKVESPGYLGELRTFLLTHAAKTEMVRPLRWIRPRPVRYLAVLMILPFHVLFTLPRIITALTAEDSGVSEYVHLQKRPIAVERSV